MWTRKELKTRAKAVLKVSYWKAFLVSIIIAIVGGNSGSSNGGSSSNAGRLGGERAAEGFMNYLPLIIGIGLLVILVLVGFRIFLGYPLEVGGRRFFIRSAQYDVNMNNLSYAFEKSKYLDIIKAMFWRCFINFLWLLLLIIPGIVKAYAFRMVPYILGDNPNIGAKRALELSSQMTAGHKFNIFVLDLSFIGWYLLGTLALFVGVLFVLPYDNATNAELYLSLRESALYNGFTSTEELNLNPPEIIA